MLAPLTVKVAASPLQINALPLILKLGKLYTVTANVAVLPLHPAALRPFKLYVVLTVGVTPILLALLLVLQVYVVAPFAVSVTPWPAHKALVPVILTTGKVFTVTAKLALGAEHPCALCAFNV